MRLTTANIAGLISPLQQSEMKSILAGTWPPLKPLPVFKYETAEYRATIDFDKKRGEWLCRKTSLPSNKVQELRGGLREITMALPHGEADVFIEGVEQQEQELEKDTNRRLQAIHDWRENYENGARYFELRQYLSESQRTEIDDSLRLSLTARQLQFNPKNVAYVFDALSVAGGRFATLIEFAKRNKAKPGTDPQTHGEGADEADEFPAVSIQDGLPEQDQASLAERTAHTSSQQLEIETPEVVEADSPSLVEHPHQEGHHNPAFTGFAAQVRTGQSSADRIEGSSSRFPVLEISAFQVGAFALLFLFAVAAFTVGLTVGRGPLGRRFREAPKATLATDVKSPTLPDQADQSTLRTLTPPVASSADSDLSPKTESKSSAKPEVNPEHSGATGPMVRNVSPPASSKPAYSLKPIGPISSEPRSPGSRRLTPAIGASPHLPKTSAILVSVPSLASQPFRASFPEKAIAATSSFAMTSQLSVLVSPESGPAVAHKPTRLEAGELVSFIWPRYPRSGNRYGFAETIRVRATIGQLGQVLDVKFLSGSLSLLPATIRAVRQWRYRPTLLDKKPVQAQQDITIEFRPPQHSSQLSTRHPSRN